MNEAFFMHELQSLRQLLCHFSCFIFRKGTPIDAGLQSAVRNEVHVDVEVVLVIMFAETSNKVVAVLLFLQAMHGIVFQWDSLTLENFLIAFSSRSHDTSWYFDVCFTARFVPTTFLLPAVHFSSQTVP